MMTVLSQMSSIIIPLIIVGVVGYGLMRRIKVYEVFLDGAKEGLKIVVDLVPTLIGLLMAVGILRASGLLEAIGQFIEPLASLVGLPGQIMPLLLIKMFSSSASTGLVLDIFKTYGPDSYIGFLASVFLGGKSHQNKIHPRWLTNRYYGGNHSKRRGYEGDDVNL